MLEPAGARQILLHTGLFQMEPAGDRAQLVPAQLSSAEARGRGDLPGAVPATRVGRA